MKAPSTPQLKFATTACLVLAFGLMMSGPWILRPRHRTAPRAYLERVAIYGMILGAAAIGAGIGAYVIMRREQEFYRERAKENLQSLIEATRQDHFRKKSADGASAVSGEGLADER